MSDESSCISVAFNCNSCGLRAVKVQVQRRREDQDMAEWAEQAASRCGFKHRVLSPQCQSNKLDLMIPIPAPGDRLGRSVDPDKDSPNSREWEEAVRNAQR